MIPLLLSPERKAQPGVNPCTQDDGWLWHYHSVMARRHAATAGSDGKSRRKITINYIS